MDISAFCNLAPYSLSQTEKEKALLPLFNALIEHHVSHCPAYAKIIDLLYKKNMIYHSIDMLPYLPINLFKEIRLLSIPDDKIFKTLLSSGTTGTIPSQIILDAETARRQIVALTAILETYLGKKRLPMLIIDSPNVMRDPKRFSARGAGIIGFSQLGRDHFYALNDHMQLDGERIQAWLKSHQDESILVFGFTFIIWQHFLKAVEATAFDLSKAILFHSGGWKKIEEEAVNNTTFKALLKARFGVERCFNFYGMAEQVGSIFVECEKGYLHSPCFADVIVRDPFSWLPCSIGETGVIQVLSILPTSYPGHSLLTEDLGELKGIDTCACGRKGKFFLVAGRVPQAEPRGCGDVYTMQEV